jgi:hypothetical protein
MIKTQIQMPEEQYEQLRAFAAQREWSLAETLRRGAELLLQVYPRTPQSTGAAWEPPQSSNVGWQGLEPDALKQVLLEDAPAIGPTARHD